MLNIKNKFKIMSFIFLGYSSFSWTCEIENKTEIKAKYLISSINDSVFKYNFIGNPIKIKNCRSDFQIAKGVEIPSSTHFSIETWMTRNIKSKFSCSYDSNEEQKNNQYTTLLSAKEKKVEFLNKCFHYKLKTDSNTLQINESAFCHIVSKDPANGLYVVSGDNCIISQVNPQHTIELSLLPNKDCFLDNKNQAENLEHLKSVSDFIANITILNILRDKDGLGSDLLFQKQHQIIISAPQNLEGKAAQVFNNYDFVNKKIQMIKFQKSNQYFVDYDIVNLQTSGNKDTGVSVNSEIFVNHLIADKKISEEQKALYTNHNIPIVLKNSIYLVKSGDQNTQENRVSLGSWYQGSVIPSEWFGVLGLSEKYSLSNVPSFSYFKLNNNSKRIQKGDKLVFVSDLQNPNSGLEKFNVFNKAALVKLKAELQKKQLENLNIPKVKVSTGYGGYGNKVEIDLKKFDLSKLIPEIKNISSISEIRGIKEFDESGLIQDDNSFSLHMLPLKWNYSFRSFCDSKVVESGSDCLSLEQINRFPSIEASYIVEDDQFEIKLRQVEYKKKSYNDQIVEVKDIKNIKINCN